MKHRRRRRINESDPLENLIKEMQRAEDTGYFVIFHPLKRRVSVNGTSERNEQPPRSCEVEDASCRRSGLEPRTFKSRG